MNWFHEIFSNDCKSLKMPQCVNNENLLTLHALWKLRFSLTRFWQKFRESNGFTKELIWRNIFRRERISRFATLHYVTLILLDKNFVIMTLLDTKENTKYLNSWLDEFFFNESKFILPHCEMAKNFLFVLYVTVFTVIFDYYTFTEKRGHGECK